MGLDMTTCPPQMNIPGETETGSAGEQPVRDSRVQNEKEPLAQSSYVGPRFLILAMPKKTQFKYCPQTMQKAPKKSQPILGLDN